MPEVKNAFSPTVDRNELMKERVRMEKEKKNVAKEKVDTGNTTQQKRRHTDDGTDGQKKKKPKQRKY